MLQNSSLVRWDLTLCCYSICNDDAKTDRAVVRTLFFCRNCTETTKLFAVAYLSWQPLVSYQSWYRSIVQIQPMIRKENYPCFRSLSCPVLCVLDSNDDSKKKASFTLSCPPPWTLKNTMQIVNNATLYLRCSYVYQPEIPTCSLNGDVSNNLHYKYALLCFVLLITVLDSELQNRYNRLYSATEVA